MSATAGDKAVEYLRAELANATPTMRRQIVEKFVLAALGAIPWIGGFLSAAASIKTEQGAQQADSLQTKWLEEHTKKIEDLQATLTQIFARFEAFGGDVEERIQSESYLKLVRRAFRSWDRADTNAKRKYIGHLITNAAGTRECPDDIIRMFIDWIDLYHEAHFSIVHQVYQSQEEGITKYDIWNNIYGAVPREDSAEAGLFRLLYRDLNQGGLVHQQREVDDQGSYLRKARSQQRGRTASKTMESSFDDIKVHVLTPLGKQFVHYAMTDSVRRVAATNR